MAFEFNIEKNPLFDVIFEKGKAKGIAKGRAKGMVEGMAEGQIRGILIGKAMSHDASEAVIQKIREWNFDDFAEMEKIVDVAIREGDWSSLEVSAPKI